MEMDYDDAMLYMQARFVNDFGFLADVTLSATQAYAEMAAGEIQLGSILHIYGYTEPGLKEKSSFVTPFRGGVLDDPAGKRAELQRIGHQLQQDGFVPAYAILMAEAWMAKLTAEEMAEAKADGNMPRPSQMGRRKEVINAIGRSMAGEVAGVMVDIIRNDGQILPGAETVLPAETVQDSLLIHFYEGYFNGFKNQ